MMLTGIEDACRAADPDWVVVYGDTNSTLAGALAAAKLHVPVAHVEAGLRSFNRRMPEELNRVVVDHIATVNFAPTELAESNLVREGIARCEVARVGDVNYDVTLAVLDALDRGVLAADLDAMWDTSRYAVATVHRAETTDDERVLRAVVDGLSTLAGELDVVLPLHPRTRRAMEHCGLADTPPGLKLIDPLSFVEMISLMSGASVVATDSGGVQKEALFLRVPCATLRTETEWEETVTSGWNRLVDLSSADTVAAGVSGMIGVTGRDVYPYGDGSAAQLILERLAAGRSEPNAVPA